MIRLLFWKLWENRIPEFARVMRDHLKYKSPTKIPLMPFLPIGWMYAKWGYDERIRLRMEK